MENILDRYLNTRCEIKTIKNELLFMGRVSMVSYEPTLSFDIVADDNAFVPLAIYNTLVKINLHSATDGLLVLGGNVYIANDQFWRICNVTHYQTAERRGAFRISANSNGLVLSASDEQTAEAPPSYPAQLVDISISGVMFTSEHRFNETAHLQLFSFTLADDILPFSLKCAIVRIVEEGHPGYTYRCSFLDLSDQESDRLCKAIFTLQRETVKKRRLRV